MPSRPGEFHPEPLTDPDLTLSRHPARATERRLPPPVENWLVPPNEGCRLPSRIGAPPVASWLTPNVGDLPPSLHGHYPASSLLRSSPPLPAASVLSASQFRCLYLFPWHRRIGSQVPYKSPNESHASYTPGTAWPVGRFPPHSSWSSSATPVLMPPKRFDASPKVRLRSSLSSIPDVINVTSFNHDVYYRSF